jgi:Cu(I)/Ag(I) efflux system membrane fusion protein
VDLGEGRLSPRDVQTGVHANGYIEITSGLDPGELVVTSGNFLIAAESRIRSATEYWGGAHGAH